MPDVEDPKASDAISGEPEATGAPIEGQDPTGEDIGRSTADSQTTTAPDETEPPLPDPFFWPEEPTAAAGLASTPDPQEVDEIMARAIRLRSVEANKIITNPADILRYVRRLQHCPRWWLAGRRAAAVAYRHDRRAGYSTMPALRSPSTMRSKSSGYL
jgi:hypothetical protein